MGSLHSRPRVAGRSTSTKHLRADRRGRSFGNVSGVVDGFELGRSSDGAQLVGGELLANGLANGNIATEGDEGGPRLRALEAGRDQLDYVVLRRLFHRAGVGAVVSHEAAMISLNLRRQLKSSFEKRQNAVPSSGVPESEPFPSDSRLHLARLHWPPAASSLATFEAASAVSMSACARSKHRVISAHCS